MAKPKTEPTPLQKAAEAARATFQAAREVFDKAREAFEKKETDATKKAKEAAEKAKDAAQTKMREAVKAENAERFTKVAGGRARNIIGTLKMLRQCANMRSYSYDETKARNMFKNIKAELTLTEGAFDAALKADVPAEDAAPVAIFD